MIKKLKKSIKLHIEKKKKGFTLVELLAVIVILAVVILIAVTAVIPRMNSAKKGALVDEALMYLKASKEVYAFNEDAQGSSCIDINDLNGEYISKSSDDYSGVVLTTYANGTFNQVIHLTDGKLYLMGSENLSKNDVKDKKPQGFASTCGNYNPLLAENVDENTLAYKLLMNEGGETLDDNLEIITDRTSTVDFNEIETESSKSGLYKSEDDYGATFYYRGAVENNWVSFGGFLWRIVRINGDGSVRLIYSGLQSAANHKGANAQIGTATFGDNTLRTTTSQDISGLTSDTITIPYLNGRFGTTYVGYMYNPAKEIATYPNMVPSSASTERLNSFPTFNSIKDDTTYYFFKNFDPQTDCIVGSKTDDYGTCTLKCRSLGNDGDTGIDCVQSNWNTLATTEGNYSTTDPGVYSSTQFIYKSDYKYTCWEYATPVTRVNSDGTTSVYVSCPIVSEIVGTVKNEAKKAKVKFHGLFSKDANSSNLNVVNSNIKTQVDNWYESNILNKNDSNSNPLESYLSDEIFCNDRTSNSEVYPIPLTGSTYYNYGPYTRNYSNKLPNFKCINAKNDGFTLKASGTTSTVTSGSKGNHLLNYPVGLITADEATFAGGKYGVANQVYYLNSGSTYWTMSPSAFYKTTGTAQAWLVTSAGYTTFWDTINQHGVRPVINLKSSVLYSSGTGTEADPYIISQ